MRRVPQSHRSPRPWQTDYFLRAIPESLWEHFINVNFEETSPSILKTSDNNNHQNNTEHSPHSGHRERYSNRDNREKSPYREIVRDLIHDLPYKNLTQNFPYRDFFLCPPGSNNFPCYRCVDCVLYYLDGWRYLMFLACGKFCSKIYFVGVFWQWFWHYSYKGVSLSRLWFRSILVPLRLSSCR